MILNVFGGRPWAPSSRPRPWGLLEVRRRLQARGIEPRSALALPPESDSGEEDADSDGPPGLAEYSSSELEEVEPQTPPGVRESAFRGWEAQWLAEGLPPSPVRRIITAREAEDRVDRASPINELRRILSAGEASTAREAEVVREFIEHHEHVTELSRLIRNYAAENPTSSVARNAEELLERALSWWPNDPLPPPRHWADAEDLADAGMEPHTVASASSEESANADDEESAHAGAESAMVGR